MKIIRLRAVNVNARILNLLEERRLIRTLRPSRKLFNSKSEGGSVETIYRSSSRFGSHKLICVNLNSAAIRLNSHPDNEEFIIVNSSRHKFRPVYMLIGLHKHALLEKKARQQALGKDDFVFLRLRYNDPATCIFTMLKETVHCELTFPGEGRSPIFFVTEPSRLNMRHLRLKGYKFDFDTVALK